MIRRGGSLPFALALVACGGGDPPAPGPPPPKKDTAAPTMDPKSIAEIPAGAFKQGLPAKRQEPYGSEWFVNETPELDVTLAAFAVDRTEVTVERYALFLTKLGGMIHFSELQPIVARDEQSARVFAARPGAEKQPIHAVTWFDARAFCLWAGGRLPTEAEWERVARGAATALRKFPWGNDGPTCARAVFFSGTGPCAQTPLEIGTRALGATPDGIFDLAGNVAEWVADGYGPYEPGPHENPIGPAEASERVVRGGGYRDVPSSMRTTARWGADPGTRSEGVGFRCAYPR